MGAVPAVSGWRGVLRSLAGPGVVAALLLPAASAAGQDINPFAGFETHYLSNGVKVWFKHLPGVPNVSVRGLYACLDTSRESC